MAKRKQYGKDFKLAAVQQWQESGKSAAEMAEELEISTSSLYTWRDQLADEMATAGEPVTTEPVEEVSEPASEEETEPGDEPEMENSEEEEPVATEPVGAEAEEEPLATEAESLEVVEEVKEEVEDLEPENEAFAVDEPAAEKPIPGDAEGAAIALTATADPEEEPAKQGGAKAIIKRILGVVGVLLGGIGLLLSIALIIVVWVINKPVTDGAVSVVNKVEIGLTVADHGLQQADQTLNNVRQTLRDVTEAVPLTELQRTLTDIQVLVDGIQATSDTAASVVGLADSFPVSLLRQDPEPVDTPKLDEISTTMGEISTGLGNVIEMLDERQESGLGPMGTEVDTRIDEFQSSLQEVNRGVEDSITATVQLQEDLPGIIDTIAIIFTLIFIWLGVAQYSLLVHGWHWLRWP